MEIANVATNSMTLYILLWVTTSIAFGFAIACVRLYQRFHALEIDHGKLWKLLTESESYDLGVEIAKLGAAMARAKAAAEEFHNDQTIG